MGIKDITTAQDQVIITREDGSILWVTVGELGADISYAPDAYHYPEMMVKDDKGRVRYPSEFTPSS